MLTGNPMRQKDNVPFPTHSVLAKVLANHSVHLLMAQAPTKALFSWGFNLAASNNKSPSPLYLDLGT